MTHPHHARAAAALWTLCVALDQLDDRVREENDAILAERATAADPLKSPSWGRRHALGGHGDPTGDAIAALGPPRPNRWAALRTEVWSQLRDVAEHLPGLADPLDRLRAAVPHMSDRMADATQLFADRIDGRVRRLLGLPADRQLVPRVPCPACAAVGLMLRGAPPVAERVVECTTCGAAWMWAEMVGSVAA
ncbi:hypothetical protein J2S43_007875 [Catenuloplanes nepalensis]|uniref:Uncharacterized protein n=1 Tax=Catenuloplanes nepalensis TaxID=587533 RepID=A0ABT9N6N9_9ACTN|nr:hypothetical protein [Catenuloplanes nepalensis]MDP9799363.1 hypothetical protein [Catenuloplanes nepalensis]